MAASDYLFNECNQKYQVGEKSNNCTSNFAGKIKATRLVKLWPCFFK